MIRRQASPGSRITCSISDDQIAIIRRFHDTLSPPQIAGLANCSPHTVRRNMARLGLSGLPVDKKYHAITRPVPLSSLTDEEMLHAGRLQPFLSRPWRAIVAEVCHASC